MKKSKLSLGLVATFIAATALTACDVTKSKTDIVSFKGYDGEQHSVITDDFYEEYLNGTKSISDLYSKVLEVLIRYEFANSNGAKDRVTAKKSLETIITEAKNDVLDKKQEARDNRKANKTTYEKEWEAILESYGCETEKELREHFIYEREKDVIEDWFFDQNESKLMDEWLGIALNDGETRTESVLEQTNSVAYSKLPYHIRHILVSNSEGSDPTRETIDETTAINLYQIFKKLAAGQETFGQVAKENSSDGSKDQYGDVGIMDNTCSSSGNFGMVPEFQLAVYAFDALMSKTVKNNEGKIEGAANVTINEQLGITNTVAGKITGLVPDEDDNTKLVKANNGLSSFDNNSIPGLSEVPYNVFTDLNEYARVTTNTDGYSLADGNSAIFPRNILWNKYLNQHNPFIITNRAREEIKSLATSALTDKTVLKNNELAATFATGDDFKSTSVASDGTIKVTKYAEAQAGQAGFRFAKNLDAFKGYVASDSTLMVLTDENANPIVGVRSEYGIHFIVIQKSIYDFNDTVDLHDYYSTKLPKEYSAENHLVDADGKNKQTYVNYLANQETSDYQARVDKIKSAIKSFDTTYDYRLFEYLLGNIGEVTFNYDLDTKISDYIQLKRDNNKYSQEQGLVVAWRNYLEQIEQQNILRAQVYDTGKTKLIPEGCVIGFKGSGTTNPEYEKGGRCYYGK